MLSHRRPLVFVEFAGFQEDAVGDFQFSNIVQQSSVLDLDQGITLDTMFAGDSSRQFCDPLGVAAGAVIPEIQGLG